MRREDIDSALDEFPSHIANFDHAGIQTGINQLNANGVLGKFVDVIKSGPLGVTGAIGQIWTVPGNLFSDPTKVAQAATNCFGPLVPTATVTQVVNAVVSFMQFLFG